MKKIKIKCTVQFILATHLLTKINPKCFKSHFNRNNYFNHKDEGKKDFNVIWLGLCFVSITF